MNGEINLNLNNSASVRKKSMSNSKRFWILWIIIIVILLVFGFLFFNKSGNSTGSKLSGYQAVFLTSGQVYFGKLSDTNSNYVTLKDVFYLQSNQQVQSGQENPQSQLSLIKLGNELHGPDDIMHINRSQILFFEDLKSDGRVATAILEYQKNGSTTGSTETPASGTQPTVPPLKQ